MRQQSLVLSRMCDTISVRVGFCVECSHGRPITVVVLVPFAGPLCAEKTLQKGVRKCRRHVEHDYSKRLPSVVLADRNLFRMLAVTEPLPFNPTYLATSSYPASRVPY